MENTSFIQKSILLTFVIVNTTYVIAADQSVINISGNVTLEPCTIALADQNKVVTLNSISTDALSAGNFSPTYFSFTFTGCDITHDRVVANVSGTAADSDVPGYGTGSVLANENGSATGVGIGLIGLDSTNKTARGKLPLNTDSAASDLVDDGSGVSTGGVLTLGAQIIPLKTTVPATPGTVTGTATVTFTYS